MYATLRSSDAAVGGWKLCICNSNAAAAAVPTMHHVMQVLHCIQGHDPLIMLHFIQCTVVGQASQHQPAGSAVLVSKRFAVLRPSVGAGTWDGSADVVKKYPSHFKALPHCRDRNGASRLSSSPIERTLLSTHAVAVASTRCTHC